MEGDDNVIYLVQSLNTEDLSTCEQLFVSYLSQSQDIPERW